MDRDQLLAWRDTLGELGVVGLVRGGRATGATEATGASGFGLRASGGDGERQTSAPPNISTPLPPVPPRSIPTPKPDHPTAAKRREDRTASATPIARAEGPNPARSPKPEARSPEPYTPPTDPIGCPSPQTVAAAADLAALESAIQGCMKCPLGPGRIRFVFGEGDPKARMMFVGEGPGRDEDLQGRPFVGKAGELLDKMIGALGYERREVWIGNIVKCRPPDNRTPFHEEAQACLGYLRRQIELIQPKVIVTLGATPLRELLGVDAGITKVRGQWKEYRSGDLRIPVMPTFHPAYVLRQYTPDVRKAVWEDLKAAKAWLENDGMMGP